MITNTISVPELVWTVFTLLGFAYNLRTLRRAVGDYTLLKRQGINSIREYAATTTMFMFATWTLVQFMFVIVGLTAMTQPSPTGHITPTSYVLTIAFILVSAMLAGTAFLVDARRKAIVEKIASMEGGFSEARQT